MKQSLLTITDLTAEQFNEILERSKKLKAKIKDKKEKQKSLDKKVVGILFEKPSTRTRASMEVATLRLGGDAVYLASSELQLKRGEPIKDTARILSSYLDCIVARVYSQETLTEFDKYSTVPIINALSDLGHPTQIICDFLTILEVKKKLKGLTLAYIGDGNNVCNSLLLGSAMMGMNMVAACPPGYQPKDDIMKKAIEIAKGTGADIKVVDKPQNAVKNADVLYTDVWVSMGDETEEKKRLADLKEFQINAELLKLAPKDAVVMHCLPAHRGLEITDDVIEGKQSIAWQQGENKLYGAIGILDYFLSD